VARAVRHAHDATSKAVYSVVRGVAAGTRRSLSLVGPAVEQLTAPAAGAPAAETAASHAARWADHAQGALNGLYGDALARWGNGLDLGMSLRRAGRDLPLDRDALRLAYPAATPQLCLFVHGAFCTERSWAIGSALTFGDRLHADLGYTPLYLRYNSGRRVHDNGALLADLLTDLLDVYPVAVEEIVLVGHSMGGLVARSAVHEAEERGLPWLPLLRHVVCLGTPHGGAPLEQAVNATSVVLRALPTAATEATGAILEARSAGIRDLRFGYTHAAEWEGSPPDTLRARRRPHAHAPGVGYTYLGATIAQDERHPVARFVGDGLVRPASALAAHSAFAAQPVSLPTLRGLHHFELTHHPDVYAILRARLGEDSFKV
jgi:pimeloyl-ACP methyl ester carboxylesterase